MKNECVKRMEMLNLGCVKEFNEGLVLVSDNGEFRKPNIEESGLIDDLQERHGVIVYHLVKDKLGFSVLYVSSYEEDWEFERPDVSGNTAYVDGYCYNELDSYLSEFGSIQFEMNNGFLYRIG